MSLDPNTVEFGFNPPPPPAPFGMPELLPDGNMPFYDSATIWNAHSSQNLPIKSIESTRPRSWDESEQQSPSKADESASLTVKISSDSQADSSSDSASKKRQSNTQQHPKDKGEEPKRKRTKRRLKSDVDPEDSPDELRRQLALEKNRIAAAKCRTQKKRNTEQLQKDSLDMAAHNAWLKTQIADMQEAVKCMKVFLLCHNRCACLNGSENVDEQTHPSSYDIAADFCSHDSSMSFAETEQTHYDDFKFDEDEGFDTEIYGPDTNFGRYTIDVALPRLADCGLPTPGTGDAEMVW